MSCDALERFFVCVFCCLFIFLFFLCKERAIKLLEESGMLQLLIGIPAENGPIATLFQSLSFHSNPPSKPKHVFLNSFFSSLPSNIKKHFNKTSSGRPTDSILKVLEKTWLNIAIVRRIFSYLCFLKYLRDFQRHNWTENGMYLKAKCH